MAYHNNPRIVTDGLVLCLDPTASPAISSSPYRNLANASTTITNTDFTVVDGIFRSNASGGAGTSEFTFSGNEITTGSLTVQWFMKVTSSPNVGSNNNWCRLIATSGGSRVPFGFVLEQSYYINFTVDTSTGNKRFLNSQFTPYQATANTWEMHTFTYDKSSGFAACYRNTTSIRSGPMTGDSSGGSATTAGEGMDNLTTGTTMAISNASSSNPNGDACLPCDLGPWLIYNKALSSAEILKNYNAHKSRFGL